MPATTYYWDFDTDNVFLEEDENGNAVAEYTQEPSLYGELIAEERSGKVRYYNFDGQGSTRELTDENGEVTDTYTYTAFGEEVATTGSTVNPFRYMGAYGYYSNSVTDDLYVRERMYQPRFGRWLSRDPLGFGESQWNLYEYVANSPIGNFDPSGLWPQMTCEEACTAYRLTPEGRTRIGGGEVCNFGTKCACVYGFPEGVPPGMPGVWPGRCPAIDRHIARHEQGHVDARHSEDCDPCRGVYVPDLRVTVTVEMAECQLRRNDIDDLNRLIPIEVDPFCRFAMERMRSMQLEYVLRYCLTRLPPVEQMPRPLPPIRRLPRVEPSPPIRRLPPVQSSNR